MQLLISGQSDIGKARKRNEDFILFDSNHRFALLADGVGSVKGGEYASKHSCLHMASKLKNQQANSNKKDFLKFSILEANKFLLIEQNKNKAHAQMASTLEVMWFDENTLFLAHIGDSRTYLFEDSGLKLLTEDQNLRSRLLNQGFKESNLPKQDLRALVNYMGLEDLLVSIVELSLTPNQVYLAASDGLFGFCSKNEIEQIIKQNFLDLDSMAKKLVNLANKKGGGDNISVILIKVMN